MINVQADDMSNNMTAASIAQSQAMAEAEKAKAAAKSAEFATPARQETLRVWGVIAGVLALAVLGKAISVPWQIVAIGMGVIGGIYGIPKAIERWREPGTKALTQSR